MLQHYVLKNGLKVATYSIPQMRSVYLALSAKGGSIFDTAKSSGLAHFMEHLLVQGTPTLPDAEAFSNFMEGLAGSYNAATYTEVIKFNVSAPATYFKDVIRISSEVFFEPLFAVEAVTKERGVILEEIRQRQDSLWYKNNNFFSEIRYKKDHPLRLDGGGSEEAVLNLDKKDLVEYWSKFFFPQNAYLVVIGGFEVNQAKSLINEFLGKYSSKRKFSGFPKLSNEGLSERRVAIRNDPQLKSCYIDLTFPSVSQQDPLTDRMAQILIKYILGGLRVSRLYKLLRQKRGLVYDVGFGSVVFSLFGYGAVFSQAVVEKVEEVISLISHELEVFSKSGPTEQELKFAKNYYINRCLMSFDHPGGIADWIEGDLLWEDKIYTPEEYAQLIDSMATSDLKSATGKGWDFSKLNLTIQGPIENSSRNIRKFEGLVSRVS